MGLMHVSYLARCYPGNEDEEEIEQPESPQVLLTFAGGPKCAMGDQNQDDPLLLVFLGLTYLCSYYIVIVMARLCRYLTIS